MVDAALFERVIQFFVTLCPTIAGGCPFALPDTAIFIRSTLLIIFNIPLIA